EMNISNLEAAEDALRRAMELNPSYAPAYLWYASALAGAPGRAEEAIEILRKTLEIDPLSRVAQNNIAANYLELGATRMRPLSGDAWSRWIRTTLPVIWVFTASTGRSFLTSTRPIAGC
ncbi:MAG: tetratricopeptide repeat protein, partial [Chromatiales bacterium]|nr:tetratricopeptide repeat protein [Chromatiales bacterium]